MEFYDDKILITIPCKHDLFETNSLFEPAINEEDVKILYNLMQMIEGTTGIIKEYLDARHGN